MEFQIIGGEVFDKALEVPPRKGEHVSFGDMLHSELYIVVDVFHQITTRKVSTNAEYSNCYKNIDENYIMVELELIKEV